MFDKSRYIFPVKEDFIYLNNCGVAPLYSGAARASSHFQDLRTKKGFAAFRDYPDIALELHTNIASFINSKPANLSFVKNTAEGLSMIANGYPFQKGDEIISYLHEYPSNHYPWKLQEKRGVTLKLLPNEPPDEKMYKDKPYGFSFETLKKMVTKKTRVIALSHVQFTSGFAVNIKELGNFCHENNIDLILDTAQSLGSIPVFPEKYHISAFASSGWKWLLGPVGSGVMYTSPSFRKKVEITMAGADIVKQGDDYLNHTWQPHSDGRKFEYSTFEVQNALALNQCFIDLFNRYGPENIQNEIYRLQDIFLKHINTEKYRPVIFDKQHRSGILSLVVKNPENIVKEAFSKGLFLGSRGGYLRLGTHFYNDDFELEKAAEILNNIQ